MSTENKPNPTPLSSETLKRTDPAERQVAIAIDYEGANRDRVDYNRGLPGNRDEKEIVVAKERLKRAYVGPASDSSDAPLDVQVGGLCLDILAAVASIQGKIRHSFEHQLEGKLDQRGATVTLSDGTRVPVRLANNLLVIKNETVAFEFAQELLAMQGDTASQLRDSTIDFSRALIRKTAIKGIVWDVEQCGEAARQAFLASKEAEDLPPAVLEMKSEAAFQKGRARRLEQIAKQSAKKQAKIQRELIAAAQRTLGLPVKGMPGVKLSTSEAISTIMRPVADVCPGNLPKMARAIGKIRQVGEYTKAVCESSALKFIETTNVADEKIRALRKGVKKTVKAIDPKGRDPLLTSMLALVEAEIEGLDNDAEVNSVMKSLVEMAGDALSAERPVSSSMVTSVARAAVAVSSIRQSHQDVVETAAVETRHLLGDLLDTLEEIDEQQLMKRFAKRQFLEIQRLPHMVTKALTGGQLSEVMRQLTYCSVKAYEQQLDHIRKSRDDLRRRWKLGGGSQDVGVKKNSQ